MEIHFDKDYLSDLFYYGKCFDIITTTDNYD